MILQDFHSNALRGNHNLQRCVHANASESNRTICHTREAVEYNPRISKVTLRLQRRGQNVFLQIDGQSSISLVCLTKERRPDFDMTYSKVLFVALFFRWLGVLIGFLAS